MNSKKYYEAYDERYKTAHARGVSWSCDVRTPILAEVIKKYNITRDSTMLEIGCGEGRDSKGVLEAGYSLSATDISPEAIRYCKERMPEYSDSFKVLDCLSDSSEGSFDFIYAIAVVHMLVLDEDRNGFYRYIRSHLKSDGIALICTMGNGVNEAQSDISKAFELQERDHASGKITVVGTSGRSVSFATFEKELRDNRLDIIEKGITSAPPAFDSLMYAVVRKNHIGETVKVVVDRPLGSCHPKYKDMIYPVNYGYVEGIIAPDGEEQDAYILGVYEPLKEFTGKVIAIIHRYDDVEEKWVVAPEGFAATKEDIIKATGFWNNIFLKGDIEMENVILTNMCMICDGKGRVLVQNRVNPNWPGITFPGGHIEYGESVVDSVIREVKEETGLTVSNLKLCGIEDWMRDSGERYIVFFYKTETFTGELESSREGEVFWVDIEDFPQMKLSDGMKEKYNIFINDSFSEHFYYKENGEWKGVLK